MVFLAVCDDEQSVLDGAKTIIKNLVNKNKLELQDHYFLSAVDLLKKKKLIQKLDILFLDVCMPDLKGLEAAEIIRNINQEVRIIFFSSSPDFVFDSFQVNPTNYLLKDQMTDESFSEEIMKYYNDITKEKKEVFICNSMHKQVIIETKDLIAIEVIARKTVVYTSTQEFTCYGSITKIYDELKYLGFYMINRSCIVNLRYVAKINAAEAIMVNNTRFQISLRKTRDFENSLIKYLKKMD